MKESRFYRKHTKVNRDTVFNAIRQTMHAVATSPDAKRAFMLGHNLDDVGSILGRLGQHDTPGGLSSTERPDGF